MNDFTKEELEKLNLTLQGYDFDNTELIKKIQSMIDKYCNHLWTDGSGNHIYCARCNAHGGKR